MRPALPESQKSMPLLLSPVVELPLVILETDVAVVRIKVSLKTVILETNTNVTVRNGKGSKTRRIRSNYNLS